MLQSMYRGASSAAALARTAFGADAAGAGANDFIAAAHGTGDAHEDAAERYGYPVRRTASAIAISCGRLPTISMIGWMTGDDIDHFLVTGACEISNRPIQCFLLDVGNFLER